MSQEAFMATSLCILGPEKRDIDTCSGLIVPEQQADTTFLGTATLSFRQPFKIHGLCCASIFWTMVVVILVKLITILVNLSAVPKAINKNCGGALLICYQGAEPYALSLLE